MTLEEKVRELSAINPTKFLLYLYLDWLIIIAAIYMHQIYNNALVYIISVIIIATRQQALGVLSHDVVHFRFLNNRKLADIIGNIFMTWPLFFTIPGYRSMHLRHHSKVNTDEDPDWVRRKGKSDWVYPMTKRKLYTMLFLDISGLNLYQNIQKIFLPKTDKKLKEDFKSAGTSYYISMGLYYFIGAVIITYFQAWNMFLIYWVVPYFTFFKLIKRLRAVGEHFGIPSEDIKEITRTTLCHPIEEFIFSQHQINYHIEHHRWAGIPFYNLPKLHKFLEQSGELEKLGHVTKKGYMRGVLSEVTKDCMLNKFA